MKIRKLRVKAFRGFVSEKEFELKPFTILFGPNATGKSSTLNAIEWCFFGKDCSGKDTGIRERVDWEIKNRKSNENPFVEIELEDGNKISRNWISKNKDEFKGGGVESLIRKFSFKDFLTGVYQHQEVIRAILTEEPKVRNEGFDRLFGLSEYRNILECLQESKKPKDTLKFIDEEISKLKDNIKAKIDAWGELINKYKEEIKKEGVREKDIGESGEQRYKNELLEELKKFIEDLSLEPSEGLKNLKPEEKSKSFCDILRNEITKLRSEMPDVKLQRELYSKHADLTQLLDQYQSRKKSLEESKKKKDEAEKNEGSKPELEEKKNNIDKKIEEIENEKKRIDLKGSIIDKAISYLEADGIGKDICPVCGKETENLLEHLKEEWEEKYKVAFEKLNKELESLENQRKNLEKSLKERESLEDEITKKEETLEKLINEIGIKLNREMKKDDDPATILNKEIKIINDELEKIKRRIEEKQEGLNKIERKVSNLEKIWEILEKEKLRERAREIENTDQWRGMIHIRQKILEFKTKIDNIITAIKRASQEMAKSKIGEAESKINEYFSEITKHPLITKLTLEVKEDKKTGLNEYEIKESDGELLTPILSQGNLNSLALSIFLALCHNMPFGFIMLDDPSQSLSSDEKERFVNILEKISREKDIIISTMDKELYEYIVSNITKQKKIYEFQEWKPDSGPEFKEVET